MYYFPYTAIACAELTIPRNAKRMHCTDGANLGSTCAFECRFDYIMVGDLLITCRESSTNGISGVWDGRPPLCRGNMIFLIRRSSVHISNNFVSDKSIVCKLQPNLTRFVGFFHRFSDVKNISISYFCGITVIFP